MPLDSNVEKEQQIGAKVPLEMLYHWEQTRGNELYLSQPVSGGTRTYTWAETSDAVRRVAARLRQMDLPPGSRISILSKNCAEWFIVDLGIMMAGHVSVPIFSTAGKNTIQYVLQHSDAKLIFVGKLDDTENQVAAIPEGITKVGFPYPNIPADQTWEEFIDIDPMTENPVPALDDMMTIIYTSGSTGQPKGVVHKFRSISWSAHNCLQALGVDHKDRLMSYLPLAHITERVLVENASFYSGMQIHFVESLETFVRDVCNTEPTLFISVPRLWTKFQMGVLAKMPQKKLNFLLNVPILKGIVAKKIRTGLGLNQARLCATGSAPIPPSTIHWFNKLGVKIAEGWGMTENCAIGTASVPFRVDKIGCIGKAYSGVDIRISDDGEIQVKGPCNMHEYYLEPEKTAEVFTEDGYLRTGDKGMMDGEGYVKITGRLKEIFKTAKGKYITPAPIEAKIMENNMVEQCCVTGVNLPQPIALLVLSEDAQQLDKAEVEESLLATMEKVNGELESHQRLDHLVVMQEEWSIENELLTPTLKVKRHVLEERFADVIAQNYKDKLVWHS